MKSTTSTPENASAASLVTLWHEHVIRADAGFHDDFGVSLEMTVGRSGAVRTVALAIDWYGDSASELAETKIPVFGNLPMKSGAALEAWITVDQFRLFADAVRKLADSLEYAESTVTPPHMAIERKAS